jgi:hypothetical protein
MELVAFSPSISSFILLLSQFLNLLFRHNEYASQRFPVTGLGKILHMVSRFVLPVESFR